MAASVLTPTQRYAAGALLALALRQAQIHQTCPLGCEAARDGDDEIPDRHSSGSSGGSSQGDDGAAQPWTDEGRGLLRPVFRFLEIDPMAWAGLEETAASSPAKHHVGAFLRILFEESDETSAEKLDQELALTKAVDAMAMSLEATSSSIEETREEDRKYEHECHKKISPDKITSTEDETSKRSEAIQLLNNKKLSRKDDSLAQVDFMCEDKSVLTDMVKNNQRKVAVLYELLSACVADLPQDDKGHSRQRKGYDARHRVALRLLAMWLNITWIKMEAMEIMVACSAIAAAKEMAQKEDSDSNESKWSKWKRGGIIGAAALTGGTLLAITGGLAAPAIAAGFGALAPTLGTLVPVIGASGFAAAASAAGSVAGSVAVAASFGAAGAGLSGSKMARRIGSVEEFEFIPIGGNHNQGVSLQCDTI
uniref:Putative membrane protein F35D11.3 n=1 Tax=Anthurium amnicola TaxID=1678845 RepID=A0A1D1Y8S8_9ARAE